MIMIVPVLAQQDTPAVFETAKGHFKKGIYHFNQMHYLAAVEFFRKAVAKYPDYYTAREYLARSYKLAGFTNEALNEWELLSDMSSDNVMIRTKIDTLRLRAADVAAPDYPFEFVMADKYTSTNLGRYHFKDPVDIAIDTARNLYISSFSSGKIIKLDPNGNGENVINMGLDSNIYGIDCYDDRLAVTDFKSNRVIITRIDGRVLREFGKTGNNEAEFHGPQGVCWENGKYLYAVDSGNNRVQKFNDSGKFILSFGKKGRYEGELDNPTGVAMHNGHVYVTDTGNRRVASFDDSGNFIKNIVNPGFQMPRGISFHGSVMSISDEKKGLFVYDMDSGKSQWMYEWDDNNYFRKLMSSRFDADGFLYCCDTASEEVYIFSPLQSRYTNLEVEVTSIDTNKFPMVAFYINVRNRWGNPVYGLTSDNFVITEDSARIPAVSVEYLKNRPASASMVLCVDRSNADTGYHNEIPWVSEFILKKMKKNDRLKVLNFNDDYWTGNDFDWSRRRALRALREREYGNGKNFGRVLYNAIGDLVPKLSRRGVVVITDGSVSDDSFTTYTDDNVIDFARSHFIPVYFITFRDADPVLKKIADATGGAVYRASQLDGLRSIYDSIRESEEYRYILVYSTFKMKSLKGWWSDTTLNVEYKGQKGVEWGGYFVP